MLTTHPLTKSTAEVHDILESGGTVILPSKLGYAFLAISPKAVSKMYEAKGRPKTKPSGILATPHIFNEVTNSSFKKAVGKLEYPVGIIEKPAKSHKTIDSLPFVTKQNGRVAFFFNMDPFFAELAILAFKNGNLVTVTSANKAGDGNSMRYADLHPDVINGADLIIADDDLSWATERKGIDTITASLIDLREQKLLRKGVFAARLKAQAIELGLITDHIPSQASTPAKDHHFQSCIYLRAFEERTYERILQTREVDWLVLDLEDGCPTDKKVVARSLIQKHCDLGTLENHNVAIRLNDLESPELQLDLSMNINASIKGFALPMLHKAEDVKAFEARISSMEKRLDLPRGHFKLFPIIETAEALCNADHIAMSSDRNIAMFLGHADLFGELYSKRNRSNLHTVRLLYLNAARAAGIAAFDTPWENVKDLPGLEKDAQDSQAIGMDGKVALTFEQLDVINRTFGLSKDEKESYERLLSKYDGGCQLIEGVFVAPPIVKKFRAELRKRVYDPCQATAESRVGTSFEYGLDLKNAHPGQIIESPYEITLDEAFIAQWQAMVPTGNPLETSKHFCEKMGLEGRLIPFHNLVNIGLCLLVETFSESSLFHLGISNVVYERPVLVGDTVKTVMIIDRIDPKSNGKMSVVETRVAIVNQCGERVVSMKRNSMFPHVDPAELNTPKDNSGHRFHGLFDQKPDHGHRNNMFSAIHELGPSSMGVQPELKTDQLILHGLSRPMGLSTSLNQSTLYKNTHPVHINSSRYGMEGLVVCGGFIIPVMHGIAGRDIRFAIDQEVVDTMHVNRIHHEDCIGAMSYIVDIEKRVDGIECLTVRTFGLKNLDAQSQLKDVNIPLELLRSAEIKPREIELLCKTYAPILTNRICARMTWKMWRKCQ